MSEITASILEQLQQYDTPTICNVIELFDVRPHNRGYMNKHIKAAFPEFPPMVGFATTALSRTFIKPTGKDGYTALPDQIARFEELSGPPVIVFQDLDGENAAAVFGEVMCSSYKAFGAVGLVTDGPGRDMEQVRDIGFPVFTDGVVCSHGNNHILDIHVPIHVGGIAIYPDDLLHGDVNGVTTIPKEIASDVADACAEFVDAEKVVIDLVQGSQPTLDQFLEATQEKAQLINALRNRIASK